MREPGLAAKLMSFLSDNISIFLLLIGLILAFARYFLAWLDVRRRNRPGTIIPLFEPPLDPKTGTPLLPCEVRYVYRKKYDAQTLSSEIVNCAVHGYLTIDYKSGFFEGTYTLQKTHHKVPDKAHPLHVLILDDLFARRQQLELTQYYARVLTIVVEEVVNWLKENQAGTFATKSGVIFSGILISALSLIAGVMLMSGSVGLLFFVLIVVLIFVNYLFATRLTYYTQEGRKLADEIEGFKLFLETAESPRLAIVGTPPTKTPELYEKYLPYAMALGVEEQWTRQFTPLFNMLERRGKPYYPLWYSNPRMTAFNPATFSSGLNKSLNSAISSSVRVPGTVSGSRGGGSSGGGAGGGGGGGW